MLDPRDARLNDILRWLTTPARCGFYFSHADIARIGRRPVRAGPASRFNALEQVIRSAALDEEVDEIFEAIGQEMQDQLTAYETVGTPAMQPWIERGRASLKLWREIQSAWSAHLDEMDNPLNAPENC